MSYISIQGGVPLDGEVSIQGSKNAVLPILAASLLVTKGKTRIFGCPNITDVDCMKYLLTELGCEVSFLDGVIEINARNAIYKDLTQDIVSNTRGSILMMGALLGRFKKAVISYPGGCSIGMRKINYHVEALKGFGVRFLDSSEELCCDAVELHGHEFTFLYPSVGATENALLCSVLAKGRTILRNAAMEPEIMALIEFLNMSGADIMYLGDGQIQINGVESLYGVEYKLPPDRIVAGTYLVAAAATGGAVRIRNFMKEDHESLITMLKDCGCRFEFYENSCKMISTPCMNPTRIVTSPHPGFPTDMQSQMMALLTLAKGQSIIEENIFEGRFRIMSELAKMGADIKISKSDKHIVIINGVDRLVGTDVSAEELRGGAALCIAGLMAEGTTNVSGVKFIKRGYEDICRDLRCLGADIRYKEEEEERGYFSFPRAALGAVVR